MGMTDSGTRHAADQQTDWKRPVEPWWCRLIPPMHKAYRLGMIDATMIAIGDARATATDRGVEAGVFFGGRPATPGFASTRSPLPAGTDLE